MRSTINDLRGYRRAALRRRLLGACALLLALAVTGCAGSRDLLLEIEGVVLYDKPRIESVEHRLEDRRAEGGAATVLVTLEGDAGLDASFDISPGIAERVRLVEQQSGLYRGRFELSAATVGGPYTIAGRVRHPQAGETLRRDARPLIVTLHPRLD